MRILVFCYEFPPVGGGAGNAIFHLSREWARGGHGVTVVTSAFSGLAREETTDGVRVLRVEVGRRLLHEGRVMEMVRYMVETTRRSGYLAAEIRPDISVAFMAIPGGFAPWLMRRRYGVPFVTEIRGGDVPGFDPERLRVFHAVTSRFIRHILEKSRFVIAPSRSLAELARRKASHLEMAVIPNGVDHGFFSPEGPPDAQRRPGLRVLSVGRLADSQKKVSILLRAIQAVDGAELTVAGDGPDRKGLERLAVSLGAAPRVRFTGWLGRDALCRAYRAADVFVSASGNEGMPNAVLEAMASSLPVVLSDIGPHREMIEHGREGFLFPEGNVNELVEQLRRLKGNEALRQSMADTARARVVAEHDWARLAERHLDFFRRAMGL